MKGAYGSDSASKSAENLSTSSAQANTLLKAQLTHIEDRNNIQHSIAPPHQDGDKSSCVPCVESLDYDWEKEFQGKYIELLRIRKSLKGDDITGEERLSSMPDPAIKSPLPRDELLKRQFKLLVELNSIYKEFCTTAKELVRESIDRIYLQNSRHGTTVLEISSSSSSSRNIHFKIADDGPTGSNGLYDGTEFAMKAIGKEFANMKEMNRAKIFGVDIPLACLIDYHGFRVLCQSVSPVDVINDDDSSCLAMSEIGHCFNMKRRVVGSDDKSFIYGSVNDDMKHLIDYGKLVPPSSPSLVIFCLLFTTDNRFPIETEVRQSRYEEEIAEMIGAKSIEFVVTELGLLAVERDCLCDNVTMKHKRPKNEFLSNLLFDDVKCVRGDAVLLRGRRNFHLYQFLRIEAVRRQPSTLSCDVFSSSSVFGEFANEQIYRATDDVLVSGMSELIRKLVSLDVQHTGYLTILCKHYGVNMRYLGLIRSRISPTDCPRLRRTILTEMVSRVLKIHVRNRLHSNATTGLKLPVVQVLVMTLNEVFGNGSNFFMAKIKIMILLKYGFICSPFSGSEHDADYSLEHSISKHEVLSLLISNCGILPTLAVQQKIISDSDRFLMLAPFCEADFATPCLSVYVDTYDFLEPIHDSINDILKSFPDNSKRDGIESKRLKRRYLREAFDDCPSLVVSIFEEAWLRSSSCRIDFNTLNDGMNKGLAIMKNLSSVPLEVFTGCYLIMSEIFSKHDRFSSAYSLLNTAQQAFEYVFDEPPNDQLVCHPCQLAVYSRLRSIGGRLGLIEYLPDYVQRSESRDDYSATDVLEKMYPPYETGICLSHIEMASILSKSNDCVCSVLLNVKEEEVSVEHAQPVATDDDVFPVIEGTMDARDDNVVTKLLEWGRKPVGLPLPGSVKDPSAISGFDKKIISVAVTNESIMILTEDPDKLYICGVDYSVDGHVEVSQFKDISFLLDGKGARIYADPTKLHDNCSFPKPIIAVVMRNLTIQLPFQRKRIDFVHCPFIYHIAIRQEIIYILADSVLLEGNVNTSDDQVKCLEISRNVKSFDCSSNAMILCTHGNEGSVSIRLSPIGPFSSYKFDNERIKSVKIDSFSCDGDIFFAHGSNLYVFVVTMFGACGIASSRCYRDSVKEYYIMPNGITVIDQNGSISLWGHKADIEGPIRRYAAENSANAESKGQQVLGPSVLKPNNSIITILHSWDSSNGLTSSEWFSVSKFQSLPALKQRLVTISASNDHQVAVLHKYGTGFITNESMTSTKVSRINETESSSSWEFPFVNIWSDGFAVGVPCPLFRDNARMVQKMAFSSKISPTGGCACFVLSGNRPYSWVYMPNSSDIQCNTFESLGHGSMRPVTTPSLINSLSHHSIIDICAGDSHALFLSAKGDLFGCGRSDCLGQGFSSAYSASLTPRLIFVPISTSDKITSCSAFADNSVVLTQRGEVYSWTSSAAGIPENERPLKIRFPSNSAVITKIGTGDRYFVAATAAAELFVWGMHRDNAPFVENARNIYRLDPRNGSMARNMSQYQFACPMKLSILTCGVAFDFPQSLPRALISLSCVDDSFSLIITARVDSEVNMSIIRSSLRFMSIPFRNHESAPIVTKDSPFYRELTRPADISLVFAVGGGSSGCLFPWQDCESCSCPSNVCLLTAEVEGSPNLQITSTGLGTIVICGQSCEAWAWGSISFRNLLQSGSSKVTQTSSMNIPVSVGRLLGFKVTRAVLSQPNGPGVFICDAISYLYGWFYRKFVDGKNTRANQAFRRYMICDETGMLRSYADCAEQSIGSFIAGEVWEMTGLRGKEDQNKEPIVVPRGINLQYRNSYRLIEDMTCVTVDPSNRCVLTFYTGSKPPLSLTSELGSEATAMLVKRMLDMLDGSICIDSLTSELEVCCLTSKITECGHILDQLLIWALREPECINQLTVEKLTSVLQTRSFAGDWKLLNTVTSILFYSCLGDYRDSELSLACLALMRNQVVLQQSIKTLQTLCIHTTGQSDQEQFDSANDLTNLMFELGSVSVYGSRRRSIDEKSDALAKCLKVLLVTYSVTHENSVLSTLMSCLSCIVTSNAMSDQGQFYRFMDGRQRGISTISMMLNANPQSLDPSFDINDLLACLSSERCLLSDSYFTGSNKAGQEFKLLQSTLEYDMQCNVHRILCIWLEKHLLSDRPMDSRMQWIFELCMGSCMSVCLELKNLMNDLAAFDRLVSAEASSENQSSYRLARDYLFTACEIEDAPKLRVFMIDVLEKKGERAAKFLHVLTRYIKLASQVDSNEARNILLFLNRCDVSTIETLFYAACGSEWGCMALAKFLSSNLLCLAKHKEATVANEFQRLSVSVLRRVHSECSTTRLKSRRATNGRICAAATLALCVMDPVWYSASCNVIDVSKTLLIEMMQTCNDPTFIMLTNIAFVNFCLRSREMPSYLIAFKGYLYDLISHKSPLVSYTAAYIASLWYEDVPRLPVVKYAASMDIFPSLLTMSRNNVESKVSSCFCFNFGINSITAFIPCTFKANGYFEVVLHSSEDCIIGILSQHKYHEEANITCAIGTFPGSVGISHSHMLRNSSPSFLERKTWNSGDVIGMFIDWDAKDMHIFVNGQWSSSKTFGEAKIGVNRESANKLFNLSKPEKSIANAEDFSEGWFPGVTLGPLQVAEVVVDPALFRHDYQAAFCRMAEGKQNEQVRKMSIVSESPRPSSSRETMDPRELLPKSSFGSFINRLKSSTAK